MKRTLLLKFILSFVILAFVSVFVVLLLGTQLLDSVLTKEQAASFYREANSINTICAETLSSREKSIDQLYDELKAVAKANHSDIRVLDRRGSELLCTSKPLNTESPHEIAGFDYTVFGPGYYEVGDFYGEYTEDMLNVMLPLSGSLRNSGYIAISSPMDEVVRLRDRILNKLLILFAVLFVLSLLILVFFVYSVHFPLKSITKGVQEFSSGNLAHRIIVNSGDELGDLAHTMNYMADELKKNADYQKKFISNVSHDFRSPLTSIKGFTEAMTDGTIPPEMHEKYLKIISGETDRLVKMTQDILRLNDMDQNKVILTLSDFDINEELKKTAAVFEGSCRKKKISIDLVLSGETFLVHADREKIEQVIYNLLDNAIKFSGKNSTITLETTEKFGKCYVSVKDEGIGIPSSEITSIWERFYKGDSSRGKDRKGTGLGLAIVREIIQAHGQRINVISTVGVGTEFVFTLDPA